MHCNFGPYLTRALRDQFVGGVRSQTTKKKLLSEDRTFEQVLGVGRADELAEKESKLLKINTDQSNSKLQVVNTVNKKQDSKPGHRSQSMPKTEGKKCFRCGSFQHRADKCSHTKTTCNYCKKAGHWAKVCFKEKRESEKCTKAHHVTATSTGETVPSETEDNQFTVNMKSVASSEDPANTPPRFKLLVTIEDNEVPMDIQWHY